jgi:hypothetical protein
MWNIYIFIITLFIVYSKASGKYFYFSNPTQLQFFLSFSFFFSSFLALSFNQPTFCPTASWNPNGITFTNQSIVDSSSLSIFVTTNNTIYAANSDDNKIFVWDEYSINPTKIISGNFTFPHSLFVTSNGDIYIGDGYLNGRVQKWIAKTNTFVAVMNVNSPCFGLFVDTNDTLYCSMSRDHLVVKISLNDPEITSIIVAAGIHSSGSAFNEFDQPHGIFVDVNFDLYVADCGNDRVQLLQSGELNGITVAGSTSPNPTINLACPTVIILDTDKNLFIVDSDNNRIVGSGLNGFRCLVGCYGQGSQSNQLSYPISFSFDRSGNMFVTDRENSRIQKFQYLESCFGKLRRRKRISLKRMIVRVKKIIPIDDCFLFKGIIYSFQ